MKKFYGNLIDNKIIIDGEELKHLAVLRCEKNEQILCFVGDENEYLCKLESVDKKQAICSVIEKRICEKNPTKQITLFIGLPKKDKLEFITQKATELGIKNIVPFESNFTIAKPNENKLDRLQRITFEACKQCGRSIPLEISMPIKFKQMVDLLCEYDIVLFANETNTKINDINFSSFEKIAIIVGSEGGFSGEEIEFLTKLENVKEVGLGSRILRCETASVLMCGLVSYLTKN